MSDFTTYKKVLDSFIASDQFKEAIITATEKAYSGGSDYKIELLDDGTVYFRWQVGNRYESPGILLSLPTILNPNNTDLSQAFENEKDQIIDDLNDKLTFKCQQLSQS